MKMKMKTATAVALVAALGFAGSTLAQPSGGPDAKGNAPLKPVHTVNDGTAKQGANSFTEGQARQHIVNSGYDSVSGLNKGSDGVWRGTAMKGGQSVNVALDFKGNVTEGGPAGGMARHTRVRHTEAAAVAPAAVATDAGATAVTTSSSETSSVVHHGRHHHHWRHRHHRRHHHHHHMMGSTTADPAGGGAAMSGIDRDHNGISDKEDRAGRQ